MSLYFGGIGIEQLEKPLFVLMLTFTAAYLTLTVGALLSGYRFLIFVVTLYTT